MSRFGLATTRSTGQSGTWIDPQTLEWNNTPSTAAPLELGASIETELSPPDDVADYFSLPVVEDRFYAFTRTVPSKGAGVYMEALLEPKTGKRVSLLPIGAFGPGNTRLRRLDSRAVRV